MARQVGHSLGVATVDSTSTDAEVQAAYDDNASYLEDGSVAKCTAFITASTILLRRMFRRASHGGDDLEREIRLIREELGSARQWLTANAGVADSGAGIKHVDMRDLRT